MASYGLKAPLLAALTPPRLTRLAGNWRHAGVVLGHIAGQVISHPQTILAVAAHGLRGSALFVPCAVEELPDKSVPNKQLVANQANCKRGGHCEKCCWPGWELCGRAQPQEDKYQR